MKPSPDTSHSDAEILIGFFRHGPAGKPDAEKFPDDALRPLTDRGRKTVKRCARGLAAWGFRPALILTSPVLRARETAEILRVGFKLSKAEMRVHRFLHFESPVRSALDRIRRYQSTGPVLLVGHEPWLGECVALCVSGKRSRNFPLRKSGFALVALREWIPGGGALVASVPPDFLEALT